MTETEGIRRALMASLPERFTGDRGRSDPGRLYLPPAHVQALRLECSLVVGSRGVGKSFWTEALADRALRVLLGVAVTELESTEVHVGFSARPGIDAYPDQSTFEELRRAGFEAFDIWRAVVVRWLASLGGEVVPIESWPAGVRWVRDNAETVARLAETVDRRLSEAGRKGLIVFDALDRTGVDWRVMDDTVRALLRVVLWLTSHRALHAKVFLREDQFTRPVTDFPDASKLLAMKSELTWQRHDLHGLLWQQLCNGAGEAGVVLRTLYGRVRGEDLAEREGIWYLDEKVKREELLQKKLFEALAGPWMGRDRRRGVPYTWIVGHLADGRGRTSPRSFLRALATAVRDSSERYGDHNYPLHYESIKRGVQTASGVRIAEMAEDYPWVEALSEPLRGLTVPCSFAAVEERWRTRFPEGPESVAPGKLPPSGAEKGWPGVREDMKKLGLLEVMADGRINMPDLYRVGFGLGRKGGVKPMA